MRAQRGDALNIAGDGRQARQFVYVEDLAAGIVAALVPQAAGRTYNLVGDERTSVREIADAVCGLVAPVPIVHVPERPADVQLGRVSGARAAAELGWWPTVPFEEGLRRYVDWLTATNGSPAAAAASSTIGSDATVLRQESGRAVVVRVVQQHDVAVTEPTRHTGRDPLGCRARLPVPSPPGPEERPPSESTDEE